MPLVAMLYGTAPPEDTRVMVADGMVLFPRVQFAVVFAEETVMWAVGLLIWMLSANTVSAWPCTFRCTFCE